jgi:hypothetical protein
VIRFVEHIYTQLVTTSNYNAVADLHALQITTAHAKLQSFVVFPSHCLVTSLSDGDS